MADRKRLTPSRIAIAALLSAGVAIAITFYVGNAGSPKAADCAPQVGAAEKIDAAAVGQLAALNGTGTGRGYSDMKFTDAAGNPVTLKDFAGKTLLVNFWASWCIPCRAEMPALDELAAAENDEDFMVLPINLDLGAGGMEKAKAFLDEGQWAHLPLYADSTFEAFKALQTEAVALGLPSTLLIDKKGCEVAVLQGPAEWQSADGINVIKALKSL
ncbi:MAG: TlpA family protein disulfide reductase [Hyphomicrobiales bacterium]|nr:MAG: TlpA family protein disulfide reductase [Hyphomicrobiales bacterium]